MDFLSIKLFPTNLVEAIFSTLIHSLWQGVLLAVITGLIIVFTRKSAPATRYNLLIGAFVLFAGGVVVTFSVVFNSPAVDSAPSYQKNALMFRSAAANNQFPQGDLIASNGQLPHEQQAVRQPTLKEMALGLINKNADSIVLIWFLIVFARSLQLATGLNGLHYLRHKSIFPIDKQWESRSKELASKLGISQIVGIAQSGIAKVPMVIGHLKPLILIPIGLLTTLTAEEVEAILVHELAHIRRRDYLVNMLQSFMEILFFFNPAVLWISALIKTERENCCDDIVIGHSSSKADYIKALVSCQEFNMSAPAYTMALTGNKNHLLTRVKRMLSNNNQSLNRLEKSLLAICLVSAGLLTAAFSNADKINTLVAKTAKAVAHMANDVNKKQSAPKTLPVKPVVTPVVSDSLVGKTDTSKNGKIKIFRPKEVGDETSVSIQNYLFTTYLYKQDGILYQINYKSEVLSSMQVNGKNIPDDHIATYKSVIDRIKIKNKIGYAGQPEPVETPEKTEPATAALVKVTQEDINSAMFNIIKKKDDQAKKDQAAFDDYVATGDVYVRQSRYKDALTFYNIAKQIKPLDAGLEKKILDAENLLEQHAADSVNQAYHNGYNAITPKQPLATKTYAKTAIPAYKTNHAYTAEGRSEQARQDSTNQANIIADMVKDGLIKGPNPDNLSFKISTEEFVINDVKQPDDIYQRYRAKYVKAVGNGQWSWMHNYDASKKRTTNTTINTTKE